MAEDSSGGTTLELAVFDFRRDLINFLVTPQIRSRFMRLEPGTITTSHTHDLGIEIFLVLEGEIAFDIAGRQATLTAGQACYALVDEPHHLRVIGDRPATIYLSVTPHVEPTHTMWSEEGRRLPPRYGGTRAVSPGLPTARADAALVQSHLASVEAVATAAQACGAEHRSIGPALETALATGDPAAAKAAVDALATPITDLHRALAAMTGTWNELSARASGQVEP